MKPLETYFSQTFGDLTVQNTLQRAQIEQLTEQLETANKKIEELMPKEDPKAKLKAVKD